MMTVMEPQSSTRTRPKVLIVDDEPVLMEMINDLIAPHLPCKLIAAADLHEARELIARERIELLVADVHLPDGDGTSLLSELREQQPDASAIVITGAPTIEGAITALRAGALDFMPKPFNADQLRQRIEMALQRQAMGARKEKRLNRLQDAVKRLSEARKTVSKKVDLLCNDLVTAYGELSKQLEDVRTQDSFRKYLQQAKDLEQMLCHGMDWLLKQMGYANIAIWLAADEGDFQLGAYMKYTVPGERQLTEAMRSSVVPMTIRKGFVHMNAEEADEALTPAELEFLADSGVLSVSCTYLGEALGVITLFRDEKQPFTDEQAVVLKSIAPIFAGMLASVVKEADDFAAQTQAEYADEDDEPQQDEESNTIDEERPRKKDDDADWWKRGGQPPF
jgi:response regulator of citrate/malate metabolism